MTGFRFYAFPHTPPDGQRTTTKATAMTGRTPLLHSSLTQPLNRLPTVFRPKTIGRNDRCWCGSEKKFKLCHDGRERMKPFNSIRPLAFI